MSSATTATPTPAPPPPPPQPSALSAYIRAHTSATHHPSSPAAPSSAGPLSPSPPPSAHHHALALQTLHNLQHQHRWTDLRLHAASPRTQAPLPRPLLSGRPPRRLYTHPDEQYALVMAQAQAQAGEKAAVEPEPEYEWVVPTHLREKWSLRRLGEVFDGVGVVPPGGEGEGEDEERKNKWRTGKRALLGVVGDDGTVVYYLVHDGLVKPRQN